VSVRGAQLLPSVRVTHAELEGPHATLAMLQREYLSGAMRTSMLRKRAVYMLGAEDERIDKADDSEDVGAFILLHKNAELLSHSGLSTCAHRQKLHLLS
jgi:hypothetical protein